VSLGYDYQTYSLPSRSDSWHVARLVISLVSHTGGFSASPSQLYSLYCRFIHRHSSAHRYLLSILSHCKFFSSFWRHERRALVQVLFCCQRPGNGQCLDCRGWGIQPSLLFSRPLTPCQIMHWRSAMYTI